VKQKILAVFSKTGDIKFISHLDLMRLFHRAVRRADLPVDLTKGFTPRLRIGFKRALKLGVESQGEEAVFTIDGWVKPEEFKEKLQAQLPEGIQLKKVLVC